MSDGVVKAICTNLLRSKYVEADVKICLHGGEPLAAGPDWFRQCVGVFEENAPVNLHVTWSVQTNATLISDEWVSLFAEHQVEVGVSLDGPREIHDEKRRNWSGQGSFEKTILGIQKLRQRGIPFSILSVLHRTSLTRADDIFLFFCELAPTEVAFNIEESEAANIGGSLDFSDAKGLSRRFFRRYWDLAEERGFPHEVREFRHIGNVIGGVLSGQRLLNEMTEPICCVTIATNGDFCTFAPELLEPGSSRFKNHTSVIGNVLHNNIDDVLVSDKFQRLRGEIAAGVAECESTCFYFPFCGGGSPSNKLFELASFRGTETFYCRNGLQAIVDEALMRLSDPLIKDQA
jgi:uncharacterized protein